MSKLHKMPIVVGLIGLLAYALILEYSVDAGTNNATGSSPAIGYHSAFEVEADMDLFGNFFVTLAMTGNSDPACAVIGCRSVIFSIEIHATASPTKTGWRRFAAPAVLLYPLFGYLRAKPRDPDCRGSICDAMPSSFRRGIIGGVEDAFERRTQLQCLGAICSGKFSFPARFPQFLQASGSA